MQEQLDFHRGTLVKSTGDGILATFDAPTRAVRCAASILDRLRTLDLDCRAGVHTGEIQRRGDDVGGLGVHIAARIMSLAGTGEVFISRTVRDLVVGSGLAFADRGEHRLKGVPEPWHVLQLTR